MWKLFLMLGEGWIFIPLQLMTLIAHVFVLLSIWQLALSVIPRFDPFFGIFTAQQLLPSPRKWLELEHNDTL